MDGRRASGRHPAAVGAAATRSTLQLLDAQGCVLAEDVVVPVALPPFDNCSMDGYAVRVADVGRRDRGVPRGPRPSSATSPPAAATLLDGGPRPGRPHHDRRARCRRAPRPSSRSSGPTAASAAARPPRCAPHSADPSGAGGEVRVHRPAAARRPRPRAAAATSRAGELVLAAGTVLGPPQIGLLAAIGRGTGHRCGPDRGSSCSPPAASWSSPARSWAPGQIHDSNSFVLTAAARDAGAIAYRVGAVADDAGRAARHHRGPADPRRPGRHHAAASASARTTWSRRCWRGDAARAATGSTSGGSPMQPGKPQGFGPIGPDRTPILALPGNPVSAYVSFEVFVRPVDPHPDGPPTGAPATVVRAALHRRRSTARRTASGSSCAAGTTGRRRPSPRSAAPGRTWSRPSRTPTR